MRVLAVDGLERRMAEQLVQRGELPALASLLAVGAHATLRAEPERVPAIVWTTVATGRGPEAHGIQSAEARQVTGLRTPVRLDAERSPFVSALGTATDLLRLTRPQPPSAALRSVKAFWNVASDKGLRVGVVNWWATWPADPVNGWLVTDRALFKLEKGGAFDRETHPASAFDALRPLAAEGASEGERARRLDCLPPGARPACCARRRRPTSRPCTCPDSTSSPCSSSARRPRATWPRSTPSWRRSASTTASSTD